MGEAGMQMVVKLGTYLIHLLARMVQGKTGEHRVAVYDRTFLMQIRREEGRPVIVITSHDN